MLQGTLGIVVDQLTGGDQMRADELGCQLAQGPKFRTDRGVEQPRIGIFRDSNLCTASRTRATS
jgi:hypothetical protein